MRYFYTLILMVAVLCGCNHVSDEVGVRISLDRSTHQIMTEAPVEGHDFVEKSLYYPRVKRLSDGALLLCFMNHHFGWDIYTRRSEDNGKTWSDACLILQQYPVESTVGDDMMVFVNPDFIELQDGRIMLAYQWRYKQGYNDLPNTNINCGIGVVFSSDMGRTWTEHRSVYRGRCWEPAMLQLPDGEIQMYITSSQNVVNGMSCPRTVVIRSFDGGKTWQGKEECDINDNEIISYTIDERFGYDGMPTAVILDDGTIAMTIEVWSGKYVVDQTPVVVKTSAKDNWRFDTEKILAEGGPDYPMKKQVNKDLVAYGPYIGKLPTGEVLVISNGLYKGEKQNWLLVGDSDADNFSHATAGFDGYWGSVAYVGDDKVIITGAEQYKVNGENKGKLHIMTGRVNRAKEVAKGEIELTSIADFNKESNSSWFLGRTLPSAVFYDFGYTDDDFILNTHLYTDKITVFTLENSDSPVIMLARGEDVYKICVNAAGKYEVSELDNNSWHIIHKGDGALVNIVGSINEDKDTDLGYAAQVRVPWEVIGGKPSRNEKIRIHTARWYKGRSKEKHTRRWEELQGEDSDNPSTWLWITLI